MEVSYQLIGPFSQLLTMDGLSLKGPLSDSQLSPIEHAGLLLKDGAVFRVGPYRELQGEANSLGAKNHSIQQPVVCLPGFVDAHTHICFAGSRARDYAMRNSGRTYLEIAAAGGGIWESVLHTRKASESELVETLRDRCHRLATLGITTLEVKSGYGLSVKEELKMLKAIEKANALVPQQLVPTCLAAHTRPRDFQGDNAVYLELVMEQLLPVLLEEKLASRIDAFVETSAFLPDEIRPYLQRARDMGFSLTLHADQFTTGGSAVAIECGAVSADHLEASGPKEIAALGKSNTIATALPGASLGLGCAFTPARQLLDAGACLAIASDYNPGSAPMGNLLTQASVLGAYEKLSHAEVLAGITFRAAAALELTDRGRLQTNAKADFILFPTAHYNEILYHQGQMTPISVWINGQPIPIQNAH